MPMGLVCARNCKEAGVPGAQTAKGVGESEAMRAAEIGPLERALGFIGRVMGSPCRVGHGRGLN